MNTDFIRITRMKPGKKSPKLAGDGVSDRGLHLMSDSGRQPTSEKYSRPLLSWAFNRPSQAITSRKETPTQSD